MSSSPTDSVTQQAADMPPTDTPPDRPFDPVDISPKAFWALSAEERDVSFAELRRARP